MTASRGIAATLLLAAIAMAGPAPGPARSATALPDDDSPAAIERLLSGPGADAETAMAALDRCRRVAADFDDRDPARFLLQHGRALAVTGDADAAIAMLARCFLLFPKSPSAPAALLETAALLAGRPADAGGDPRLARRLAERAAATAAALGLADAATAAGEFLEALPADAASPTPRPETAP